MQEWLEFFKKFYHFLKNDGCTCQAHNNQKAKKEVKFFF